MMSADQLPCRLCGLPVTRRSRNGRPPQYHTACAAANNQLRLALVIHDRACAAMTPSVAEQVRMAVLGRVYAWTREV